MPKTKTSVCKCGVKFTPREDENFCSKGCRNRKVWKTDKEIHDEVVRTSVNETAEKYGVSRPNIYVRYNRYRETSRARASLNRQIEAGADLLLIHPTEMCVSGFLKKKLKEAGVKNLSQMTGKGGKKKIDDINLGHFWRRELDEALEDTGIKLG